MKRGKIEPQIDMENSIQHKKLIDEIRHGSNLYVLNEYFQQY